MEKQSVNPFLPSYEYIPDGEPYVFGNRVYVFGSHDKFNGKNFCLNNYVTWSAPIDNLGDWKYEGLIYDKFRDPLINRNNQFMYAPDVQIGPDQRYYLFYFFNSYNVISVAVCDKPAGNYQFYGHIKYPDGTCLGKKKNDPHMFDPAVFMDDDGKVYLYIGFSPELITKLYFAGKGKHDGGYVVELEQDMLTVKEGPKLIIPSKGRSKGTGFEGHEFFEASSMRKYDGKYYYVYSSVNNHELCYATSNHPKGPFKYGGVIISNADIGFRGRTEKDAVTYHGNNHGGIVRIGNKWFIVYHRHTNKHSYSRQACAEEIVINSDGSINQVELTSCGFNAKPLIGKGIYSSHIACNLFSKHGAGSYSPLLIFKFFWRHPYLTQTGKDRLDNPSQYIAGIRDGSIVGFKYFDFNNLTKIGIHISGKAFGVVEIFNDLSQKSIGRINIKLTHNSEYFETNIMSLTGIYPLYFKYIGKGKVNFMSFQLK